MTCDQALALISARMDREIQAGDRAPLEAHLQDCPACRTAAEALQVQDAELRRGYAAGCRRGAECTPPQPRTRLADCQGPGPAAACGCSASSAYPWRRRGP